MPFDLLCRIDGADIPTAPAVHGHAIADVAGLVAALAAKLDAAAVSAAALGLLDDADAAAMRTTLGLGTMATEAAATYATVAALTAGLAAKLDAAAVSAAALALLDDADAAAMRTTLGLGSMATEAAATYATVAALTAGLAAKLDIPATPSAGRLLIGDGSSWVSTVGAARALSGMGARHILPETVQASASATATATAGQMVAWPFARTGKFQGIAGEVTTGHASSVRLGLYSARDDGYPDALIEDCGAVSVGSAAVIHAPFAASRWLSGLVWAVALFEGTPTMRAQAADNAAAQRCGGLSSGTLSSTSANGYFATTATYGALPATFPAGASATAGGTLGPLLALRTIA